MELLRQLENPSNEYTPFPFWFLNGDLCEVELGRQLKDFKDHGICGVVLHPRMGLPRRIAYLEETFFRYIRYIVSEAASLDMKVVLYDEGMYPSGSACGKVVEGHPELASEGIGLTDDVRPGDEILAQTSKGTLVARKSGGTLRGIHWGEDDGEPYAPASADILNPEAVRRFIHLTHDAYYKELKEYFENTIIGFFTDEPSILGRNAEEGLKPWTHGFAGEFTALGGNLENLVALFAGEHNADTDLYDRLILARESRCYYKELSKWCEEHNIALMGHPHQSDDIEVEKYFHIPGQDLVLRWIAPEKDALSGIDSTMGKCSADAAWIMGRRRNSNECFGACNKDGNPWAFSGGDMKWYLDWLAVRGANLYIPHAYYYSIVGRRKDERPPDVGPHSIWWKHYDKWTVYMRRLSLLMTDCDLVTPVAVLCQNRDLKADEVRTLYEQHIGFRYLPKSVWHNCRVDAQGFWYKDHCYKAVMGDTSWFEDAPRDIKKVRPDCICTPDAPMLRVAHFIRSGIECWFLVNEGNGTIRTTILLPTNMNIGSYDLWKGKALAVDSSDTENGCRIELELEARASILLFACKDAEYRALPHESSDIFEIHPSFNLVMEYEDSVQKIYSAQAYITQKDLSHKHIRICLDAEEMAELEVNGVNAGVEFWAPQIFDIKEYLHEGINSLIVTVTGSLANKYGRSYAWYGLRDASTD